MPINQSVGSACTKHAKSCCFDRSKDLLHCLSKAIRWKYSKHRCAEKSWTSLVNPAGPRLGSYVTLVIQPNLNMNHPTKYKGLEIFEGT